MIKLLKNATHVTIIIKMIKIKLGVAIRKLGVNVFFSKNCSRPKNKNFNLKKTKTKKTTKNLLFLKFLCFFVFLFFVSKNRSQSEQNKQIALNY